MIVRQRFALWVIVAAVFALGAVRAGSASDRSVLPLRDNADVVLPGGVSRFDYEAVDSAARRLYIAHLGDSTLDVVDLDASRVVTTVSDLAAVHGVAVAPDRQRVYATATGTNELAVIDTRTNAVIARVATGRFPDGVAYDADDGLVVVSDKNDGTLTVIDAKLNARIATIKLADETGNVIYDPTTRTVYAAAHTPDALVAIDPTTRRITSRVGLPGCEGAHGVYVDAERQRAFVACEGNARLVSVDLHHNRVLGTSSVGANPDVLASDPTLERLYVAAESGTVSVFDTGGRSAHKISQGHLADHAHSIAVDPATHRIYVPLQDVRGRPTLRIFTPDTGAP